jgi:deoxycytidine triphosphate deaminase
MILSDREIKLALQRDQIRITPAPSDQSISSTSVDLTLHEEISFWTSPKAGSRVLVSPRGRSSISPGC